MSSSLDRTIDKILNQAENDMVNSLKESYEESKKMLEDYLPTLRQDYDKITASARKEADKLHKQMTGSASLQARNKQLLLIQESVDEVFEKAKDRLASMKRDDTKYKDFIKKLVDDTIKSMGTKQVIVKCSSKDVNVVKSAISEHDGAELSDEYIDCIGGVKMRSKDGSYNIDNTIEKRIEYLKPLIRKDIAKKFSSEDEG